jgi:hypothetical protein
MKMEYLHTGSDDCPLIRIYGTDTVEFATLRDALVRLARGEVRATNLNELAIFGRNDTLSLKCALSGRNEGVARVGRACDFDWQLTRESWEIVSGLVDPFTTASDFPCYQWLTGREAAYGLDVGTIGVLLSFSITGEW